MSDTCNLKKRSLSVFSQRKMEKIKKIILEFGWLDGS